MAQYWDDIGKIYYSMVRNPNYYFLQDILSVRNRMCWTGSENTVCRIWTMQVLKSRAHQQVVWALCQSLLYCNKFVSGWLILSLPPQSLIHLIPN